MEIIVTDFGELGKLVTLAGRLDILGAEKIDLPLAVVAGSRTSIVIDMGGVDFIASIGIRHLGARGEDRRPQFPDFGTAQPETAGVGCPDHRGPATILPIVRSEQEAEATLSRYAG